MIDTSLYDELQQGNSIRAREEFAKRLEQDPNDIEALFALGSINAERRQHIIARDLMRRAHNLNPHASIIRFRLALCEEKCLKIDTALSLLDSIIKEETAEKQKAIIEYARILVDEERYEQATHFCYTYGIQQQRLEVMISWAKAMAHLDKFDEAYNTLKPLCQSDNEILTFALWCYDFYHYHLAIELLKKIDKSSPDYLTAMCNIIQCYIPLQEYAVADKLNTATIPQCTNIQGNFKHLSIVWNKNLFDLTLGRFKDAIPVYHQVRWHTPTFAPFKRFYTNLPFWEGQDIRGKSLLVQCEQGIGDQLFFVSYIPYLQNLGCTVYLSCNDRLVNIFKRAFPYVHVIDNGAELLEPEWVNEQRAKNVQIDYVVEMGSLFHFLPLQDTDYAAPAYLQYNEVLAGQLRRALQQQFPGKKLIGFNWYSQGANAMHRSLPAHYCAPLFEVEDCVLINLQYGRLKHHLEKFSAINANYKVGRITNFDINQNFDNLSALLKALDGAITIGNVTAYFINYLNVPNITLINADAGWRFGFQGSKTPWLSNLNITRERVSGDWRAPIADAVSFMQNL